MRCNECNIDLGETVGTCPLCGAASSDTPPVIPGLKQAEYPERPEKLPQKKERILPNKYVLRVAAVLGLLFFISGNSLLYSILAPVMFFGVAVYLFVCGLKEKGNLLHSAVAMVAEIGIEAALMLLHLIARHNCNTGLFILIVTVALTVCLYALRSDRFAEQMRALLRM